MNKYILVPVFEKATVAYTMNEILKLT